MYKAFPLNISGAGGTRPNALSYRVILFWIPTTVNARSYIGKPSRITMSYDVGIISST